MRLCLKSIGELIGLQKQPQVFPCDQLASHNENHGCSNKFLVPSFQRGYRWAELQVEQLVQDISDFHASSSALEGGWYCLQPLVVVNQNATWTVIDGQQRLTTLLLILKALNSKNLYEIAYETRADSKDFLDKINNKTLEDSQKHPDYYCMWNAWKTIGTLLPKKDDEKNELLDTILDHVKVIWYQTSGNPYDEFSRLNTGKISLSNAELMKALLLQETLQDGNRELSQLEAAQEWDRMEHSLRDDDFWCFINPEPNHRRFDATRIDFLFEMVLRKDIAEVKDEKSGKNLGRKYLPDTKIDISHESDKNQYFIFATFQKYCEKEDTGARNVWHDVQSVYRRIRSWYEDRVLFHSLGYLMNRKGASAMSKLHALAGWLRSAENMSKSEMRDAFNKTIRESISKPICNLSYGQDNDTLCNILLLFNIAIMMRQQQERSQYPFREHRKADWTLEHIHAKQERGLETTDLMEMILYLGIDHSKEDPLDDTLNEAIEKFRQDGKYGVGALKIERLNDDGKLHFCDNKEIHGLGNLALLGHKANSTFNDRLFREKVKVLAEWEKGERESDDVKKYGFDVEFIPIATRMAFFKHFSSTLTFPFLWTEEDSTNYVEAVQETLIKEFGFDREKLCEGVQQRKVPSND